MDNFTRHYLATGLWAETDDDGDSLDANYGIEDIDDGATPAPHARDTRPGA